MAKYIYDGDLLDCTAKVIVHQCYCTSSKKSSKGLAHDMFEKYPYANVYSKRKNDSEPGTIEIKGGKEIGRFVCAFYSQIGLGKPTKSGPDSEEQRLRYFTKCLIKLARVKNLKSVAFPYGIGCGLGGGVWKSYANMIEKFARDNSHITVFVISKDSKPEEEITPAFVKWIVKRIKDNPNILQKYPEFLADTQEEYYEYLHEAVEEASGTEIEINVPENTEETHIQWTDMTLEEYTESHIPEGWDGFFKEQLDVDCGSIHELSKYLVAETQKGEIYPELGLVYNIFCKLKPSDIKVIIIGQDPYINPGEAMGISFSVPEGIDVPPSLRNIYKELTDDGFTVKDKTCGDLTKWCDQGVFLINSALSVRAHESGSHSKKWNVSFSTSLMRWLNENCGNIVVIMWGNHAQSFSKLFGENHRKIVGVHPSPLSAHKGFFGSRPFSKANKHLLALGYEPIDWSL